MWQQPPVVSYHFVDLRRSSCVFTKCDKCLLLTFRRDFIEEFLRSDTRILEFSNSSRDIPFYESEPFDLSEWSVQEFNFYSIFEHTFLTIRNAKFPLPITEKPANWPKNRQTPLIKFIVVYITRGSHTTDSSPKIFQWKSADCSLPPDFHQHFARVAFPNSTFSLR